MNAKQGMIWDCIVVGAGLSGLLTAVRLQEAGVNCLVVEARNRAGGRILTKRVGQGAFDLGPAWFWGHHTHVQQLMAELGVAGFQQYEQGVAVYDQRADQELQYFRPPPMAPAYRFTGGVGALIDGLVARLAPDSLMLGTVVSKIRDGDGDVVLETDQGELRGTQVVCTLPPKLVVDSLVFEPALSAELQHEMGTTMTWMGQAMKVVLQYEQAFWREKGLSGLSMSHVGPVAEFRDHVSAEGDVAALFGWVGDNSPAREMDQASRRAAIIAQAIRLFGPQAAEPLNYAECNWADEPFTTHPDHGTQQATEHPQYGHPLLQRAQFGGKLHWATTEAAAVNGGYLDGAVYIAETVAKRFLTD